MEIIDAYSSLGKGINNITALYYDSGKFRKIVIVPVDKLRELITHTNYVREEILKCIDDYVKDVPFIMFKEITIDDDVFQMCRSKKTKAYLRDYQINNILND